eukprot:Skav211098  [mRNA]  locus=scaffold2002:411949:412329:+ [translate_table: standard]
MRHFTGSTSPLPPWPAGVVGVFTNHSVVSVAHEALTLARSGSALEVFQAAPDSCVQALSGFTSNAARRPAGDRWNAILSEAATLGVGALWVGPSAWVSRLLCATYHSHQERQTPGRHHVICGDTRL